MILIVLEICWRVQSVWMTATLSFFFTGWSYQSGQELWNVHLFQRRCSLYSQDMSYMCTGECVQMLNRTRLFYRCKWKSWIKLPGVQVHPELSTHYAGINQSAGGCHLTLSASACLWFNFPVIVEKSFRSVLLDYVIWFVHRGWLYYVNSVRFSNSRYC